MSIKGFNTFKKSVNTFGSEPTCKSQISEGVNGEFNKSVHEPVPKYLASDSEMTPKPIKGANNTWIILGRDRVSNRATGYGGKGHTQSGAIDIVVGLGAPYPRRFNCDESGTPVDVKVNKNFTTDAARIYISQKTDVDENFNLSTNEDMLKHSSSKYPSRGRSAIAIKADAIRIIGREGIKLVTRTDSNNSQGGKILSTVGIDLVAGNNSKDLQPMVKGENLVAALNDILVLIQQLSGLVYANIQNQADFNSVIAGHVHVSPMGGAPTTPSIPIVCSGTKNAIDTFKNQTMGQLAFMKNIEAFRTKYTSPSATINIRSKYNNVN